MNDIILTVVTVTYNDLAGLRKTEKSIARGNPKGVEWVVIDGGSRDGSLEFIKSSSIVDKYISEKDGGIYDAMNKGMAMGEGRFFVFMNAGDYFEDLQKLLDFLVRETFKLVFCNAKIDYGRFVKLRKARDFRTIWHGIPANHQAIIFHSEIVRKIKYPIRYKICGDYAFLAEIYRMNYSSILFDDVVAIFEAGGVSTKRPFLLIKEAVHVQLTILKIPYYLVFLSAARRAVSLLANYVAALLVR